MNEAQPLRVLHVIPTLEGGGAENFLCALVQRFDRRFVRPAIMAVYPTRVPFRRENQEQDIPVIFIGRTGRYDPWFFGRMVREMRSFHPDVVHAHLHNGKYWGRLAAIFAGVPVVFFTEHNPCAEVRGPAELLVDILVNRFTAGIVTFSDAQRRHLTRMERLASTKIAVIENGIALPPPPTPERRDAARNALGVSGGDLAVLVVARLIQRKNQQLAIRALERLPEETRRHIRLFLIGSGEDEALLKQIAAESPASENVRFLGNRDDVAEMLYGGDLFYMPSLAEGMPLAMLEAMSAGLPVVSTPWTGVASVLQGGEFGTILDDFEPATTAAVFAEAIRRPHRFQRAAESALAHARRYYDIDRAARLHESLYRRAIEAVS